MAPDAAPDTAAAGAQLRRAADVLLADSELRAVGAGIAAYSEGDAPTLEIALSLKPSPGQRSAPTTIRISERDRLIRQAAAKFFLGRASAVMPPSLTQAQP